MDGGARAGFLNIRLRREIEVAVAGQKQFDPSSRKIRKAREEGDVAKSRELTGSIILGVFVGFNPSISSGLDLLVRLINKYFAISTDPNAGNMVASLLEFCWVFLIILAPILCSVLLCVILVEALQVGFHLQWSLLAPKWSRLSLTGGLTRLLGVGASEGTPGFPRKLLGEVCKSALYLLLFGGTLGAALWRERELCFLGDKILREALAAVSFDGLVWFSGVTLVSSFSCGIIDLLIQRRRRQHRLRMDAEELKREFRESEGDPEIRSMRKQLHHELLHHSLVQGVRRAKVVVVGSPRGV